MKVGSAEWNAFLENARNNFSKPAPLPMAPVIVTPEITPKEKPVANVPIAPTIEKPAVETQDNFTAIRDREMQRNPNLPSDPDAVPIFDYDFNADMGVQTGGEREHSPWDYMKPKILRDDNDPQDAKPELTPFQKVTSAIAALGTGGAVAFLGGANPLSLAAAPIIGDMAGDFVQFLTQPTTETVPLAPIEEKPQNTKPEPKITTPDKKEIQRNTYETQRGNSGGRDGSSADTGTGSRTTTTTRNDYSSSASPHAESARERRDRDHASVPR